MKPNKATQQASLLCQVLNGLPKSEGDGSVNKSVDRSIAGSLADSEAKAFDINDIDLFGDLIIIVVDESQ